MATEYGKQENKNTDADHRNSQFTGKAVEADLERRFALFCLPGCSDGGSDSTIDSWGTLTGSDSCGVC